MLQFSDIMAIPLYRLAEKKPRPVKVAVLDTGLDACHEAIRGRIARSVGYRCERGETISYALDSRANNDSSGHGTGVAAIIAALAPNARLIDYRVLDAGNGGYGSTVLQGLRDAIDSDAEIINVSVAFAKDRYWEETAKLLEEAYRRNKIVVAAKRNIPRPGDLGLPAELSNAVSVDSGDYANSYRLHFCGHAPIEFSARGTSILTARTGGGYTRMSGTSFATPVVSAFCALLRGLNRNLKLFEIKTLLKYHAESRDLLDASLPDPLETAPFNSDSRYQQVEYSCKSCGHRVLVSDAFSNVKCSKCGVVGKRDVLLEPRLYFNVIEEIKETVPQKYCFHDWRHTRDVVEAVYRIIPHCPQLTVRQKRCLLFAALTHDMGFSVTARGHEAESARIAVEIAEASDYQKKDVTLIQSLIMATVIDYKPRTLCEKIIRDADLFHLGTSRQRERSRLLRNELANCGQTFSNAEWNLKERTFLANHHFNLSWLEQDRVPSEKHSAARRNRARRKGNNERQH